MSAESAQQVLSLVQEREWRQGAAVTAQCARVRAGLPGSDAEAELRTAEELFERLEMSFYVAATRVERAERRLAEGLEETGQALLAEAREELVRLGAAPWVERVDAALGREPAVTA
jgi:hypothetical protein